MCQYQPACRRIDDATCDAARGWAVCPPFLRPTESAGASGASGPIRMSGLRDIGTLAAGAAAHTFNS